MTAIATHGLTKRFGDLVAVDDVSFEVDTGGVVGFVGPNGSGKSTTIRVLLGLIAPTAGSASVLGTSIEHPERFADRVGALIEGPAFVESISGRDNLRSLAALRGLPPSRIDEVLDIVGLTGRDDDKVKGYSLGMKQRLGIAAALLPDPELLILDEPTNGLDPAGVVEIRSLLRRLADEGRTVIVSSHLLSEIQAACDDLVIIRFGKLLYSGSLDELMAEASEHVVATPNLIEDLPQLTEVYRRQGWSVEPEGSSLQLHIAPTQAVVANYLAAEAGIYLNRLTPVQESLEEVFLRMTGETDAELALARSGATVTTPIPTSTPTPKTKELV